jgi:hypothetical protein
MKNTMHDPYLFNPDNTYLSVSTEISYCEPSDRLSKQEKIFRKKASKPSIRKKFFRSISAWLYFQLEYHILGIFIVAALLTLGFLLSGIALWQILQHAAHSSPS